jgi:hypothetical protein
VGATHKHPAYQLRKRLNCGTIVVRRNSLSAPGVKRTAKHAQRVVYKLQHEMLPTSSTSSSALPRTGSRRRARAALQNFLGDVRVIAEGDEQHAEVETRADRLLLDAVGEGVLSGPRHRFQIVPNA